MTDASTSTSDVAARASRVRPGATLAELYPDPRPDASTSPRPGEATLPALRDFNAVAEFATTSSARDAIVDLERSGYESDDLSYLALDSHEGDLDLATSDAATAGFAVRRVAAYGTLVALLAAVAAVLVALLVGASGPAAIGVGLGAAFAGFVVGGYWGVGTRLAIGDSWAQTYRADEGSRGIVGVHGDASLEVRDARRLLVDAGAVRTFDVDRDGDAFTVRDSADHRAR